MGDLPETPRPECRLLHFGDPCIHCGTPHDAVEPGLCHGDPAKAKCIGYQSLGVRWDGVEHFLLLMSTGSFEEHWYHISEHAPYWQFKHDAPFGHPPPYRQDLMRLRALRRAMQEDNDHE